MTKTHITLAIHSDPPVTIAADDRNYIASVVHDYLNREGYPVTVTEAQDDKSRKSRKFDYKANAYQKFADLTDQRFRDDALIERHAAQFVADWLAEHNAPQIDVDDENETPSYARLNQAIERGEITLPDGADQDEMLDHAVAWLPKSVIRNTTGNAKGRPSWNPVVTAADLAAYLTTPAPHHIAGRALIAEQLLIHLAAQDDEGVSDAKVRALPDRCPSCNRKLPSWKRFMASFRR